MNKKAINYDIKGIECDSLTCDWQDLNADFDPEAWLNKPCPSCGANLFTEEAYKQMQGMQKMIDAINGIVEKSGIDLSNEEYINLSLKHNEKGLVNGFEVLEKEEKDNE